MKKSFRNIRQKKILRIIVLNIIMALSYILAIVLNYNFSSFPNSVTSLCFSSGVTLAMVYCYRAKVLPGIIIGCLFEVITLFFYNDRSWSGSHFSLLFFVYAVINCSQPFIASYLIKKYEIFLLLSL